LDFFKGLVLRLIIAELPPPPDALGKEALAFELLLGGWFHPGVAVAADIYPTSLSVGSDVPAGSLASYLSGSADERKFEYCFHSDLLE